MRKRKFFDILNKEAAAKDVKLVKKCVEQILRALKSVTIGLDGSSDGCGNPIEHVMAMKGEHQFLLEEIHMHSKQKNAINLLTELKGFKKYLEEELDCGINGFNRDNESKMRLCGEKFLEEEKVSDIGCGPHV